MEPTHCAPSFFFKAEFLKPKITKWLLDQIEYGEKKQFEIYTSYQIGFNFGDQNFFLLPIVTKNGCMYCHCVIISAVWSPSMGP